MTAGRIPVFATIVVALAVATMIALGFWQLGRARERDRLHEELVARVALPTATYPHAAPTDLAFLYRRVTAQCARVTGWQTRGGEGQGGGKGWARIATCVAPSGSRFLVDMGIARAPSGTVAWSGGEVTGRAVREPDTRSAWQRLTAPEPARALMIVAETPAPGLDASKQPDPADESNSSWSYTVQWFLFAATAAIIYTLALRRRRRGA